MFVSSLWFCMDTSCVTCACCLPGNHPRDHFIPVMESNYALPPHGGSNVSAGSVLIGRRGSNDDVGTSDVISSVYSNEPVKRFDGFFLMMDVPKLLNSHNSADSHGCARFNVRKTTKLYGDNCHAELSFPQIALIICQFWYLKSCK